MGSSAKGDISQLEALSPSAVPTLLVPPSNELGGKNSKALITQMQVMIKHLHPPDFSEKAFSARLYWFL